MHMQINDQVLIAGKIATVKSVSFTNFHYCYEKFGPIYSMNLINSSQYRV